MGISDAYNTGIKAANADILAFLSSDGIWKPNKLTTHVEYMMDNREILFTNLLIEYFLKPGSEIPHGFRNEQFEGVDQFFTATIKILLRMKNRSNMGYLKAFKKSLNRRRRADKKILICT